MYQTLLSGYLQGQPASLWGPDQPRGGPGCVIPRGSDGGGQGEVRQGGVWEVHSSEFQALSLCPRGLE